MCCRVVLPLERRKCHKSVCTLTVMPFFPINLLSFKAQSDDQTLNSPILLHLAHPYTLQNFITALKHVKEFRAFLGSLPAGGENSQIAKEVLVDLVDCSGVDLTGLISTLEEVLGRVQSLDRELYSLPFYQFTSKFPQRSNVEKHLLHVSQQLRCNMIWFKAFKRLHSLQRYSTKLPYS